MIQRKSMWVINHQGERIDIMDIHGIYPVSVSGFGTRVQLNIQETAGADGGTLVSSSIPTRPITFQLKSNVIEDKKKIKKAFRPKKDAWLYYSNEFGEVTRLQFQTEECEISPIVFPVTADVTIQCENPYFRSINDITVTLQGVRSYFSFPFTFPDGEFYISKATTSQFTTINNKSDVDVGYVISLKAKSAVVNPSILNVDTNEKMQLQFEMQSGDEIQISTHSGEKAVELIRNGERTNIINYISQDFIFFPLYIGENLIKHDAENGLDALEITLKYSECYTLE